MFSLRYLIVALALATTNVFAQLVNPISRPTVGDVLIAGGTFDILWTPTTTGSLISLILRKGPGNNIGIVGPIADSIQNSGSYLWNIPATLPAGLDYAVQIIVGPASNVSNVGPDAYNFTPLLELKSNYTGPPTTNGTIASVTKSSVSSFSSAASESTSTASVTATSGVTTTVSPSGTKSTGGSGSTQTAASTSTAKSSGAVRIEGLSIGGHGLFALIVALAIGIVASF